MARENSKPTRAERAARKADPTLRDGEKEREDQAGLNAEQRRLNRVARERWATQQRREGTGRVDPE